MSSEWMEFRVDGDSIDEKSCRVTTTPSQHSGSKFSRTKGCRDKCYSFKQSKSSLHHKSWTLCNVCQLLTLLTFSVEINMSHVQIAKFHRTHITRLVIAFSQVEQVVLHAMSGSISRNLKNQLACLVNERLGLLNRHPGGGGVVGTDLGQFGKGAAVDRPHSFYSWFFLLPRFSLRRICFSSALISSCSITLALGGGCCARNAGGTLLGW